RAMAFVSELDVLEVYARTATQFEQSVTEEVRLLDRTTRVVRTMHHQQLGAHVVGKVDGAAVAPQVGILHRITHLLTQEILEVLHGLLVHLVQVSDANPGNRRLPDVGFLRHGHERHVAAVTATEHADALCVNICQALYVLCCTCDIFQVRAAPILERHVTELHAVARAATNVGLNDDVTHVHQKLCVRVKTAEPLRSWAAMHDDDGGPSDASGPVLWLIEYGGNLQTIERVVP